MWGAAELWLIGAIANVVWYDIWYDMGKVRMLVPQSDGKNRTGTGFPYCIQYTT